MKLRKVTSCPHCKNMAHDQAEPAAPVEAKVETNLATNLVTDLATDLVTKVNKPVRKRPRPVSQSRKPHKRYRDIYQIGYGCKKLVTPVQAAVNQAKALLALKRKCKDKACEQMGSSMRHRPTAVYNRKRDSKRKQPSRTTKRKRKATRRNGSHKRTRSVHPY